MQMLYEVLPLHIARFLGLCLDCASLLNLLRTGLGLGGESKTTLLKICDTYPIMMKLGTVTPYLKIPKIHPYASDKPLYFFWQQQILLRTSNFY